jgi:ribosomal protein S18 acetylase RimI-like enzyme
MIATTAQQQHAAADGRRYSVRGARPTDARPLASLFAAVRAEGRWLVTPATAVSESSESFWIGEMIRTATTLALVAEADGEVIGNVLVTVERNGMSDHVGTLSICVAADWRDVGIGGRLLEASLDAARRRGLAKVVLGVFPDNERAIAAYQRAGFVREGLRRRQYRGPNGAFRDELLNVEEFGSLLEAQVIVEAWRIEYNTYRPHGSLGGLTPTEYATNWTTKPLPVLPCLVDH